MHSNNYVHVVMVYRDSWKLVSYLQYWLTISRVYRVSLTYSWEGSLSSGVGSVPFISCGHSHGVRGSLQRGAIKTGTAQL